MKRKLLIVSLFSLIMLGVFVSAAGSQDEVRINLKKGWNLVGMYAFDDSLTDLANSGFIKAAYIYDNVNKQYIRLYPNRETDKIASSGMLDAENMWKWSNAAVWIYCKEDKNFAPSSVDQPSSLSSVKMKQGWNFMAITPEMWNKPLNDFKGTCNIEKAYGYEQNSWAGLSPTFPINHEELIGSGIIVKVSSDCALSSSSSGVSNPPAIPN